MPTDDSLVEVLVDFARDLLTPYQVSDILDRFCDRTVSLLGVSGAGVMLADETDVLRFVVASDETVRLIEGLQIEFGEGPCLQAYKTGEQIVVADLERSDYFPRFAERALEAGMRSVSSFPMNAKDRAIGALNLYRREPGGFDDRQREIGQVLADVATGYVLNARAFEDAARLTSQLQHALDSRVRVEQAKGRVAEQLGIDVQSAFELIRRHARSHGRRLDDVAAEIVGGGLRLRLDRES